MKRKKEPPKERNPFVLHLSKRPSGAHGKTKKAKRRLDKITLRKSDDYFDDTLPTRNLLLNAG